MDSTVERQREVVARHIRGENEHDWPAVYDTFVQDDRAHYDVMPLSASFKGIYDVPGCSIREVVITGTHRGNFAGLKPLGNRVRIEMAAFYTFDESSGKLISERIYYDKASAVAQMQGGQASAVA